MIAYLAVFIGGGTGSLLRFAISNWYAVLPASFPYGTLISNVASCVILGFIVVLTQAKFPETPMVKTFFTVGFCGGFSTFSTFTMETFELMRQGDFAAMGGNILFNLVLCGIAIVGGMYLAKMV